MPPGAHGVTGIDYTFAAGADLSAKKYFAVKPSTAAGNTVLLGAADTDNVIGILQNAPGSGEAARVRTHGKSVAVAGAAVSIGDRLEVNASGKVIPWATSGRTIGFALQAAAADGEQITIFVLPGYGTA